MKAARFCNLGVLTKGWRKCANGTAAMMTMLLVEDIKLADFLRGNKLKIDERTLASDGP